VAVEIREADTSSNIWILDFGRLTLTRLTFLPTGARGPLWAADGRRILFNSGLGGGGNLFWQAADGSGDAERLLDRTTGDFPTSATSDGAGVILSANSSNDADVTMLPLNPRHAAVSSLDAGESPRGSTVQARPLVHTQFSERNGVVSPDGRWLAYESNASGRLEIYVRSFPQVDGGQSLVSTSGGSRPLWARDGRELFYLSEDGTLMSVPVEQTSTWKAGTPRQVLQTAYFPAAVAGFNYRPYDISPDGKRFLMIKQLAETEPRPGQRGIMVVTNWLDEVKRLVPANK
jgi:serine/threonine-protein kinase